jgi:hypothetical protein
MLPAFLNIILINFFMKSMKEGRLSLAYSMINDYISVRSPSPSLAYQKPYLMQTMYTPSNIHNVHNIQVGLAGN